MYREVRSPPFEADVYPPACHVLCALYNLYSGDFIFYMPILTPS